MQEKQNYPLPIILAITLHFLLLMILFIDIQSPMKQQPLAHATKKVDIVKATTVDQSQVEAEVAKLKQQQIDKQQAQLQRQRQLQAQAKAAQRKRQAEQRRLARLKQQLKKQQAQQKASAAAAAKKLAALKQQQAQETRRLATIKKQKQALAKQRATEAKRLAKLDAQRKAQAAAKAKKAAELAKQAAAVKAQSAAALREVDKYKAMIVEAISQRWIVPDNANQDLSARLAIRLAPGGTVLSVSLVKSSGDPVLDRSAEAAVYKASPLPVPSDPGVFAQFRNISLTVRPERVLSGG